MNYLAFIGLLCVLDSFPILQNTVALGNSKVGCGIPGEGRGLDTLNFACYIG